MEGQRDVEGSRSERHVVALTPPGEKTLHPDGVIGEHQRLDTQVVVPSSLTPSHHHHHIHHHVPPPHPLPKNVDWLS